MSNLFQKASIITTPTAYNDGELLSVKPNNGDGDFDFTRGSSATRVNEQGLIEDVQILSGELVQNGNFEQIGSELVTNGDFATDSDWTKGAGATISNGRGNIIGDGTSFTNLSQSNVFTVGKFYKVTLDAVINSGLGLKVQDGSTNENFGAITTSGTYTFYGKANNSTLTIGRRTGGTAFDSYIDNVSVKEVGQNWTVENENANNYIEFNQEEGTVRLKFLNTSPITQLKSDTQYLSGKKYKLTVDVKEVVSGAIKIDAAGVIQTYNSVGVQEAIIEPTGNSNIGFYRATADVDITLNSVSLIEITDDTDLPRINYTNFDYENGEVVPYSGEGSLLLEPQATNLITNSESYSVWNKDASVSVTSTDNTSPTNESNASKITVTDSGRLYYDPTISTTADRVTSIFLKGGSFVNFKLTCIVSSEIDLNAETASNGFSIEKLNEGWFRISTTAQSITPTSRRIQIQAYPDNTYTNSHGQTGTYYVFGTQMEDTQLTSYIPTEGSTVTRLADVCNNAGSSDLINSTEGVLYAEISALADDGTNRILGISNGGDFNNSVLLRFSSASNRIQAQVRLGGVYQCSLNYDVTDATEFNKIAFKYKQNDFSLFVNGVERATDTSGNVITGLDVLDFDVSNTNEFYGNVKCVAVFKEALSDQELACLTS